MFGWELDDRISPAPTLRQGDLIHFANSTEALKHSGLVVTADCDLENRKHARVVTLVPIVTPDVILEYYLLPEDCDRRIDHITSYLANRLGIPRGHDRETAIALIREAEAASPFEDLTPESVAAGFLLGRSDIVSISGYSALMTAIGLPPKKADSLAEQMMRRGDLLVLPEAQELGIAGCIAWIRHIWQVPTSDIAIKTSDLDSRSGEKRARLASPFRYRLTQLLGQVFSDIGLPNAPNSVRDYLGKVYAHE